MLEELYKLESRPAIQTSATVNPIDISYTEKATHVYVKVDNPGCLAPRFEGPYKVVSRPSRSQVQVRIGSYASGEPRLQTYSWNSCKIANLRPDTAEGSRPNLGRRRERPSTPTSESKMAPDANNDGNDDFQTGLSSSSGSGAVTPSNVCLQNTRSEPAKIQMSRQPARSTRNPNPQYVECISPA